ncbi:MAG: hypothetical protein JSV74_01785 [Dehalococcoidia bacterium]|nr:MAG: hypothetical protein JSV74_01785 [Dehalococcoidia bacterium]
MSKFLQQYSLVMLSEIRKNKLKIICLLAYFITVFLLAIIIHEFAHFLTALTIGVPFSEIEIGWIGYNPGVTIPDRFFNVPLDLFYYSGGFSAAFVLLCGYFLVWYKRYRDNPSFMTWAYSAITMTFIGMQLGQGYLEGRFHAAYIFYADSLFNAASLVVYGLFALAMFSHFQFFPITELMGQKRELRQGTEDTIAYQRSP